VSTPFQDRPALHLRRHDSGQVGMTQRMLRHSRPASQGGRSRGQESEAKKQRSEQKIESYSCFATGVRWSSGCSSECRCKPNRVPIRCRSMFEQSGDMRRLGLENFVAIYHSHPTSASGSSRTDLRNATIVGRDNLIRRGPFTSGMASGDFITRDNILRATKSNYNFRSGEATFRTRGARWRSNDDTLQASRGE